MRIIAPVKSVTRRHNASRRSCRRPTGRRVGACGHAVQFYPTDGHLLDLLTRFIGTTLVTGDVGIVIATKDHRDGLEKRLKARGLDVTVARRQRRYVALDAAATLRKIHPRRPAGSRAVPRRRRRHRSRSCVARGERRRIVGRSASWWRCSGPPARPESAIRLEEMWNELARELDFCLCCAYPMSGFGNRHAAPFMKICAQHSHVFTVAQTAGLPDACVAGSRATCSRLAAVSTADAA